MRKLSIIVIGLTPMLTAAAFAQAPNAGDEIIVQAQAGGQMNGQGQTSQPAPSGMDRMNEQGKPYDPTASPAASDKDKAGYQAKERKAKQDPSRDNPSQVRKDGKQPKDSGG